MVPPTPACARALDIVVAALERAGHSVQAVSPPAPYEGLVLASQLLAADGCYTFGRPVRTGEALDPGAAQLRSYMRLPRVVKYLHYLWVRYARRDRVWAGLLRDWYPKSSAQQWRLVDQRETYRARWHSWWTGLGPDGPDVLLTVPHAAPALPHGATRHAFSSCGYTFLFNLVTDTLLLPSRCVPQVC